MGLNQNIWEIAEAYLANSLSSTEIVELNEKLKTEADFASEFNECINLLKSLEGNAKQKQFRKLLQDVHDEQSKKTHIDLKSRIIALPHSFWRTAAVAATVALLTSTFTYWSLTPSIKKNDSQYNTISREVEHIKKGLKNNSDEIATIKKNTNVAPTPSTSYVKYTGTGFALTNDGYFVTAYHVINQGNFDSVYIQNNNGEYYRASLVRYDEKSDLAILKVEKKNFRFGKGEIPYSIANNKIGIGEHIFTIGYPKDVEVYSEGYISSKNGFEGNDLQYTLDLPAGHGQSGSPVVDKFGNIVAILTATGTPGESNTYAVSTKSLADLLNDTPGLNKLHISKTKKYSTFSREQQIGKIECYSFSVKVFKK